MSAANDNLTDLFAVPSDDPLTDAYEICEFMAMISADRPAVTDSPLWQELVSIASQRYCELAASYSAEGWE